MLLPASALPKEDPLHPSGPGQAMDAYKRLWVHETLRVFYDRLVDSQDRVWLLGQLQGIVAQHLGTDLHTLMGHLLQPGEAEIGQEQLRRCGPCARCNAFALSIAADNACVEPWALSSCQTAPGYWSMTLQPLLDRMQVLLWRLHRQGRRPC